MINFNLVNKNHEVLATIHKGEVQVTEAGKAELIKLEPCPKFGGKDLISPNEEGYANAFFLFILSSILPSHPDWEWERQDS